MGAQELTLTVTDALLCSTGRLYRCIKRAVSEPNTILWFDCKELQHAVSHKMNSSRDTFPSIDSFSCASPRAMLRGSFMLFIVACDLQVFQWHFGIVLLESRIIR